MENETILVGELLKLITSYRAGATGLHTLASRSESLVEQLQAELSAKDFACAMNCVYLFEELNALVLDESRQLIQTEHDAIEAELALLERLVS